MPSEVKSIASAGSDRTGEKKTIVSALTDRFHDAIAAIEEAKDAGCNLSPSEWLAKYPDVADQLAEYFADQERFHQAIPILASSAMSLPIFRGLRYRALAEIAHGGMGMVLRVQDMSLERPLAVKTLLPALQNQSDAEERLLREARITGRLQHPGIPPVHEVGELADGRPFFAMKLIEGRTLSELLRERTMPQMELPRFLSIFGQIAQTLAYAHAEGVIHRDLKPLNVMIGAFGEVQVMDWGLAKVIGDPPVADSPAIRAASDLTHDMPVPLIASGSLSSEETHSHPVVTPNARTQAGQVLGTLAYIPPEQARGELDRIDKRSDVFGLGAILCTILTGQPPYRSADRNSLLQQACQADLTDAGNRLDACGADEALVALTKKCLAPTSEERPAHAGVVAEVVARYLADLQQRLQQAEIDRTAAAVKVQEERKRSRAAVIAAILVTVTLVAGLVGTTLGMFEAIHHAGVATKALEREDDEKKNRVLAQVNALADAAPGGVPGILADLEASRATVLPQLRSRYAEETDRAKRMRLALALLPIEPENLRDGLTAWMLQTKDPAETVLVRDALRPYAADLCGDLWRQVSDPTTGRVERFRALVALASFDPDNPRWQEVAPEATEQLLTENALHLGSWVKALHPARLHLLSPLSDVFRGERLAEQRQLAATVLADYAADQPHVLADLLMDADEKQFVTIFPKFKAVSDRGLPILTAEIDKKPLIVKDSIVLTRDGEVITDDDAKVTTQIGLLPAKKFSVRLQAGRRYQITMHSKDLDSFLVLQDKSGQELAFDDNDGGNLNSMLVYTPSSADDYTIFAASFGGGTGRFALKVAEMPAGDGGREKLVKRQANAAVALLRMQQEEKVWPLLRRSQEPDDPSLRSHLVHRFGPSGVDGGTIAKRLGEEPDVTIRRALILSLGEYGEKNLSTTDREKMLAQVRAIFTTEADPGLHAASEWLLRKWKQEPWLKERNEKWAMDERTRESRVAAIKELVKKDKEKAPPQWYVNGQGQTMVVIPGPVEFMMGSPFTEADRDEDETPHKKRIGRTFAVASTAVTKEQFLRYDPQFIRRMATSARNKLDRFHPEPSCPIGSVMWYEAAEYCNWLSEKEGIPKNQWCYEFENDLVKLRKNYLSLSGYRLPTEAEIEYATRAGARTSRFYGDADALLPMYAWYHKNSQERTWPVGSVKPNDFGLFDVNGSVFTWGQERYQPYPKGQMAVPTEDKEHDLEVNRLETRVIRGGSMANPAAYMRSAYRGHFGLPGTVVPDVGFRVARTLSIHQHQPATPLHAPKGQLAADDPKDRFELTQQQPHKVHDVHLEAAKTYQIDLTGNFDAFLRIEDAEKKPLVHNDDVFLPGEKLNSRLVFTPAQSAKYRLIVTTIDGRTGPYSLTINETTSLEEPWGITGKLTKEAKKKDDRHFQVHRIPLRGGIHYTVELQSADFVPFLILANAKREEFAATDGRLSTNASIARIDLTPDADEVFWFVTTTHAPEKVGSFTLRLQGYLPKETTVKGPETNLEVPRDGNAQSKSATEAIGLAGQAIKKGQYALATQRYREAFRQDPMLADKLDLGHRYNAACYAVLAAAGKGDAASELTAEKSAQLRQEALVWLKADLAAWSNRAANGSEADRKATAKKLRLWLRDTDLTWVRDGGLDQIPVRERLAWQQLWSDVAALLKRVDP